MATIDTGYVTVDEADSFLEDDIRADDWIKSYTLVSLPGEWQSDIDQTVIARVDGGSDPISITIGDAVIHGSDLIVVLSVIDEAHIKLSDLVDIATPETINYYTAEVFAARTADRKLKSRCLITAFREFDDYLDLPDDPFTDLDDDDLENLKKAQIYRALELLIEPTDQHEDNQNKGIASFSISKQSYSYRPGVKLPFSRRIMELIGKHAKGNFRPARLVREGRTFNHRGNY